MWQWEHRAAKNKELPKKNFLRSLLLKKQNKTTKTLQTQTHPYITISFPQTL